MSKAQQQLIETFRQISEIQGILCKIHCINQLTTLHFRYDYNYGIQLVKKGSGV